MLHRDDARTCSVPVRMINAARVLLLFVFLCQYMQVSQAQNVSPIKITAANARLYRDTLIQRVFGPSGFPYQLTPDSIFTNVSSIDHLTSFPYSSLLYPAGNLDSIDRFVIRIDPNTTLFPSTAKVYLFHPHSSNGKLFIYHAGHCAGTAVAEDFLGNADGLEPGTAIPRLLAEGYTVLAVPMIYYRYPIPDNLVCGYNGHDPLFMEGYFAHPLGLFFRPLVSSLNYVGRQNYSAIYMTGLSGGGWTTSIYPAMDSSIQLSFPVAGSWPVSIRTALGEGGDYEQFYPPVFQFLLDYHELYTLSCLAPERKMLQINNRYDGCCFQGATAHLYYVDSVDRALQGSNGQYRFYLDETHNRHAISPRALDVMMAFITGQEGALSSLPADTIFGGMPYHFDIAGQFRVNGSAASGPLRYSLLKAPSWLSLDTTLGILSGTVPSGNITTFIDTVSFKVEDSAGHFVLHSYQVLKKRTSPVLFTMNNDNLHVYLLPIFSNALDSLVNQEAVSYFYSENPSLQVQEMEVWKGSVLRLTMNQPVRAGDSIGYRGFAEDSPIRYRNGQKMEDFRLRPVLINAVTDSIAYAGMIRFNSETRKFEYFNGTDWVNMN